MNSFGEFVLPFGESFLFLENRLSCYVPYYIPFTNFLLDGGSVQTTAHSFFNISTQTRQYLGNHTFLRESFPAFLDSINALILKLVVLTEATSGKESSLIALVPFFVKELEYPFVDPVLYDISETPTCISSMVP